MKRHILFRTNGEARKLIDICYWKEMYYIRIKNTKIFKTNLHKQNYIYIYIYIYTHTNTHTHTYMNTCMYIHDICIYV